KELGGLHILGTERHESRRIDNQLRGRSGRQGDPGTSRFYLALDDDLMRLFGSDRIAGLMDTLGMQEGEAIENRMVSRAIEGSQKRVEAHNFEIRKQLLDYDNVMNQQREVIYARRREIMYAEALDEIVEEYVDDLLSDMYAPLVEAKGHELDEETEGIISAQLDEVFDLSRFPGFASKLPTRQQTEAWIQESLDGLRTAAPDNYQEILRYFILETLDRNWKDHLLSMDHLRDGIGLRGYGQKDPKQEYKREGFDLFRAMLYAIAEKSMSLICRLRIQKEVKEEEFQHKETVAEVEYQGPSTSAEPKKKQPVKRAAKVGRNDSCSCGSGKKFKNCCMK
ncbi:MAG: SEC-C metal-binding domain-containing protein, partial [Humidesulfovibrio sp.]|nr:SEC-C metal-binding domain-containing protein [Humidesulfovibrio sp.]